jgi:glycosyltransferase involved in cell wall biosynthesis
MVVLVDEGPRQRVRGLFELSEERDGPLQTVRVAYRPSTGTLAYGPAVLLVARRLARRGTPIDILHAHVHRMGWAAFLAGTLLRRPVVISEHSSEWPSGTITPRALRRARIAFSHAAVVCPVNAELRAAIERYGVQARFRIVPNCVDTVLFQPPAAPIERDCEPSRLVNVALHLEVKAIDVLLRAFAMLASRRRELTLELIGDGPLTPRLRELAGELGVGDRTRFSGRLAPARVADALRAADVFVLSSRTENLPVSLLEALSCGLPVAATRVGGVAEAVGGDGVLAQAGDPRLLADAIDAVLRGHSRFDRTGIASRAAKRYSFSAVGGIWDAIYRSV